MTEKSKDSDIYYTINKIEKAEIKRKGSRFIANAAHAKTKEEAMEFVTLMRSQYYDATHNCFAFSLGFDGMEFRAADDGEPSGTAGKPILFSIKKFDFNDIVVVVTRYFGGTKLGVGPLARAYSDSAAEALVLCTKAPVYRVHNVRVFCTYEDISIIKRLVSKFAVEFDETYLDSIEINAKIPLSKVHEFCDNILTMTNARAGTIVKPEIENLYK